MSQTNQLEPIPNIKIHEKPTREKIWLVSWRLFTAPTAPVNHDQWIHGALQGLVRLSNCNDMHYKWSADLPESVYTTQTGVLPPNLVKPRSREIGFQNYCIVLQLDKRLNSAVAEMPVKFQNDHLWPISNRDLAALCQYIKHMHGHGVSDCLHSLASGRYGSNFTVQFARFIIAVVAWILGVKLILYECLGTHLW